MKQLPYALLLLLCYVRFPVFAQPGSLDSTLAGTGKVLSDLGTDSMVFAHHTVLQADGKILVTGAMKAPPLLADISDLLVVRYEVNGDLDLTFGGTGYIKKDFNLKSDGGNCMAVQADGKILVGGYATTDGNDNDFCLMRLLPNGDPDPGFGSGGYVLTDIGNYHNQIVSVMIQPDQKIIASGTVSVPAGLARYALTRYLPDGTPDSTFGTNGIVTNMGLFTGYATQCELLPDGKILCVGRHQVGDAIGADQNFLIARHNADGSFDTSFGANGQIIYPLGTDTYEYGWSVVVQPDHKIVVLGETFDQSGSHQYFYVARFDKDMAPDLEFGSGGSVLIPKASYPDLLNNIAIQPNGKINLCGCTYSGTPRFLIKQLNPDGSIDSTFGTNGEVQTSFDLEQQCGYGMTLVPGDKLLAAGTGVKNGDFSIVLARYNLTGLSIGTLDFARNARQVLINPNPLQAHNLLRFTLETAETISIELTDLQGRVVKRYCTQQQFAAGEHVVTIAVEEGLAPGVWLLVLRSDQGVMTVKVVI